MRFAFVCCLLAFLFYAVYADTVTKSQNIASAENCFNALTSLKNKIIFRVVPMIFNSVKRGNFERVHQDIIDIMELWAIDLNNGCCASIEGKPADTVVIMSRFEEANDILKKVNQWLKQLSYIVPWDEKILNPYKPVINKFQDLINCLIDLVPKSSSEFEREITTLISSFEAFKKKFD